jgi:alpha-beta hydrolase superfamily lysophospholipase
MAATSIYYLPGHGGRLTTGLGEGLLSRGFDVAGRETVGEFRALPFGKQVELVAGDLASFYWHEDACVVANSFGAYLFLHAQASMTPYIGKVLLLSPIVGEFSNDEARVGFIPPQAEKLSKLAEGHAYPVPMKCEIHVGEHDWQSVPANVIKFARHLGLEVTVVSGAGHMLGKRYVSAVLDRWLGKI